MGYSYKSSRNSSVANKYSRSGSGQRRSPNRGNRGAGQYIDPARFVQAATASEATEYVPMHTFADFPLAELLQKNLAGKGYKIPSPIQDQAIPVAMSGKDVIGIASTGTGKTAAFALPLLHRLITEHESSALIIAPTRELAQQIDDEFRMVARGSGLHGAILIGGAPMGPQLRDLSRGPRIVIGTPGRIKDHMERGTLNLASFNLVVLDEVDRMLDMGFILDMRKILATLAPERQSFFYSATLDSKVKALIDTFVREPVMISVKTGETSENVEQGVVTYRAHSEKIEKLHDLLIREEVKKALVFDETQRSVEKLSQELLTRGFRADAIHGGKNQSQRTRALNRFKKDEVTVLVATDVAARGIDVSDITHVINFTTPNSYEDYVHRIGRAGRAGKKGHAYTFVEG